MQVRLQPGNARRLVSAIKPVVIVAKKTKCAGLQTQLQSALAWCPTAPAHPAICPSWAAGHPCSVEHERIENCRQRPSSSPIPDSQATAPERGGQDVAQCDKQLLASGQHIWHCLHNAHNRAADGILVGLHEWLQVLAARDDSQKCQRLDLSHAKVIVDRYAVLRHFQKAGAWDGCNLQETDGKLHVLLEDRNAGIPITTVSFFQEKGITHTLAISGRRVLACSWSRLGWHWKRKTIINATSEASLNERIAGV